MIRVFFRGRENTHGRSDKDGKKSGVSKTERRQRKREKAEKRAERQRILSRSPIVNPALPKIDAKLAKYRLDCGNPRCGNRWFGNTQEPFCSQCGSNLVSWTLNF